MSVRAIRGLTVAALVLLIGVAHVWRMREGHAWGGDFSLYILHAKNLALGVPYAETGYIYNPDCPAVGPPTYPPICPLLLAPVYKYLGLNLAAMKGLMIGCFLLFLALLSLCFRQELPFGSLLALVAIVGLNHYFLEQADVVGSDMPFLALLYLGILLIKRAGEVPLGTWRRPAYFVLAGVVTYLAFGTRTLGALLIPAMLLEELLRLRRIPWSALLGTAVFAGLAAVQAMLVHSDHHYLDQLGAGPAVLVHNAYWYVTRMAAFWHNGYVKAAALPIFAVATVLAVLGFADRLRQKIGVCEIFTVLYLLVLLVWPSYQGERYLFPIFPLYAFYVLAGLQHTWLANRRGLRRAVVVFLLLAVPVSYASFYTTMEFGRRAEGVDKPESVALFDFIATGTGPDDAVMFIKPRVMSLFAGRSSSVYHRTDEDAEFWDYLRGIDARYIVVIENNEAFPFEDPLLLEFVREFAARNGERLGRVYANRDFTVYRIDEGPPAAPPTAVGGRL